jgi:hypothetical protein
MNSAQRWNGCSRHVNTEQSSNLLPTPVLPCVECGLVLPIRLASGSEGERLVCVFCGSIYRGVLVEDAPESIRDNVRRM